MLIFLQSFLSFSQVVVPSLRSSVRCVQSSSMAVREIREIHFPLSSPRDNPWMTKERHDFVVINPAFSIFLHQQISIVRYAVIDY